MTSAVRPQIRIEPELRTELESVLQPGETLKDCAMTTTTIRLEDDLKARVAAAAKREGKRAHAFILDAIAQTVEQAELNEEFQRVADTRWTKVLETGKTVPWDEAKAHLKSRALDSRARKPAARKLRR